MDGHRNTSWKAMETIQVRTRQLGLLWSEYGEKWVDLRVRGKNASIYYSSGLMWESEEELNRCYLQSMAVNERTS